MTAPAALGAFVDVVLPQALPGIISTALFTFILAWNEYFYALILVNSDEARPVTTGVITMLVSSFNIEWSLLMAASVAMSLPLIIIFVFLQGYLVKGFADDGHEGLTRWVRRPASRSTRLRKQFGEFVAVNDLDLDIRPGEFVSLLGPSGCGKTTTLRMLAGLEFPTSGTIRFGERVVNDLAPAKRDIAMVFQSYALYPHMTVAENIAYPLKKRGVPKADSAGEGRGGRAAAAARTASDAQAAPALWRPAAARGARPRAGARTRISSCSTSRCRTWTRSCAPTCVPS